DLESIVAGAARARNFRHFRQSFFPAAPYPLTLSSWPAGPPPPAASARNRRGRQWNTIGEGKCPLGAPVFAVFSLTALPERPHNDLLVTSKRLHRGRGIQATRGRPGAAPRAIASPDGYARRTHFFSTIVLEDAPMTRSRLMGLLALTLA